MILSLEHWHFLQHVANAAQYTCTDCYGWPQVKQQERRAARTAKSPGLPPAKTAENVIVSDKATASEAAQVSKLETAEAAEITVTPLPLEG